MSFPSREVPISATIDAILDFLEKDNQFISSYQVLGTPSGEDITVNYLCRRSEDEISIYSFYTTPTGKLEPKDFLDSPNGPGNKVFGFKISKVIDDPRLPPRSLVKGSYNEDHKEMFLVRWVRLGMAFGADWNHAAKQELDTLIEQNERKSGTHMGWTEWKDGPTPGSKMRLFGLVPNVTPEKFLDFDLHISPGGHVVASSPEGEATAKISNQLLSDIQLTLDLIQNQDVDENELKEFGQTLYNLIFPESIHTHLHQTEAAGRKENAKLRLRLRVEDKSIASLPLEFIYRKIGGYYLSINPNTVLSRYLNLQLPPERIRRREGPLHMLLILSEPSDQGKFQPDKWDEMFRKALSSQIDSGQLSIDVVKRATSKEIAAALKSRKPDIIQYVGHGEYKNGRGYILLVNEETGKSWPVTDDIFANLFMGHDDHLGLISLTACESAESSAPQAFIGVAPKLVERGTPAVIAMQYSVQIKSAKVFFEDFYASLAARKPVDWAVQSARNAVSQQFGLDNREFATPVLYMRAKDGNLF